MIHRQAAIIEDVYADPRVPKDAYRPTLVKSMAMIPVRVEDPTAAIGTYWATRHRATEGEVATRGSPPWRQHQHIQRRGWERGACDGETALDG
jgi:hypothetical protein